MREDLPEGWKRPVVTVRDVPHLRGGWKGVWRLFVATLLRRPISYTLEDVTFSIYIKPPEGSTIEATTIRDGIRPEFKLWGAQLQKGKKL